MNDQKEYIGLNQPVTLEQIRALRLKKLEEIRAKQQSILAVSKRVAAPVTEVAYRGNALSKSFGIGMTMFQGLMTGLRMMRNFRALFPKKHRR